MKYDEEPTLDYITNVIFPKYNIKGKLKTNKIVNIEDITIGNYNYDHKRRLTDSRMEYIGIDPTEAFDKTSTASIRIYPNANPDELEQLIYKIFRDKNFKKKWFKRAPSSFCGEYITIGIKED